MMMSTRSWEDPSNSMTLPSRDSPPLNWNSRARLLTITTPSRLLRITKARWVDSTSRSLNSHLPITTLASTRSRLRRNLLLSPEIAKELKLADDRANKAGADAGHFESLLREEQTKVVKIDSAKKALENEVRTLSVRIEEIETNSVATSKRTIQKMEIRIQELEVMINEEKKSHSSTMSELHMKTRSIKELILQSEEDRKNIIILQESLDKLNEKIK